MKKYIFLMLTLAMFSVAGVHAQSDVATDRSFLHYNDSATKKRIQDSMLAAISEKTAISKDPRLADIDVDYYRFVYNQRKAIYSWQLTSSKIILIIVVIVVLTGLYLSYLQFMTYARLMEKKMDTPVVKAGATEGAANGDTAGSDALPANTIEVSKDGIKLNSAVIGLVILIVSIAFFFLYLQFVFGINTGTIPQDALNTPVQ